MDKFWTTTQAGAATVGYALLAVAAYLVMLTAQCLIGVAQVLQGLGDIMGAGASARSHLSRDGLHIDVRVHWDDAVPGHNALDAMETVVGEIREAHDYDVKEWQRRQEATAATAAAEREAAAPPLVANRTTVTLSPPVPAFEDNTKTPIADAG